MRGAAGAAGRAERDRVPPRVAGGRPPPRAARALRPGQRRADRLEERRRARGAAPLEAARRGAGRIARFDIASLAPSLSCLARRLGDVGDALAHVHTRGYVHRDVKPGNVLVDAQGQLKLGDFGSVATVGAAPSDGAEGDARYLAPECVRRGRQPRPGGKLRSRWLVFLRPWNSVVSRAGASSRTIGPSRTSTCSRSARPRTNSRRRRRSPPPARRGRRSAQTRRRRCHRAARARSTRASVRASRATRRAARAPPRWPPTPTWRPRVAPQRAGAISHAPPTRLACRRLRPARSPRPAGRTAAPHRRPPPGRGKETSTCSHPGEGSLPSCECPRFYFTRTFARPVSYTHLTLPTTPYV